jgi:thiol-disulfide isomerase/thioredoxin
MWRALAAIPLLAALGPATARARASEGPQAAAPYVLAINGGGSRAQNYQSHLLHVTQLLEVLRHAGIPPERISVFSGDGADPAEDLAVRELEPEPDFWLLRGTRLERPLAPPIVYRNSAIAGTRLQAATKAGLRAWFKGARARLRPGDTLLLYVTDHGTKNAEDTANNQITLWGDKESLSVSELRGLLEELDPGVRVVELMSQCYSGAFAHLLTTHAADGLPRGAVCGYFSSTADRPAYGCYPENRGRNNVGHSFHFIRALATSGSFPNAHADVLVTDMTPDVPLTTSDLYLEELLRHAAEGDGAGLPALVDSLLREAWHDKAAWEPEIRLLDRIGHAFGIFSPRSLAELDAQTKQLPDISEQLETHAKAWKTALGDLAQANLDRFLDARPAWAKRTTDPTLRDLGGPAARRLTKELLADLAPYTRADTATETRLRALGGKQEVAATAAYRMNVRLGAVLRLRTVLTSIAGRVYVATRATAAERAAYEALRRCEDLRLSPGEPAPIQTATALPAAFPPYDDDVKVARDVLPAWMGIQFRQASNERRGALGLKDGAASVLTVYPDSPARAAGLEAGDIVVGPPDRPFTEPHQIREWIMLSALDQPAPLDVLRGEQWLRLSLVPKPYPLKWPELPGPPKPGAPAPPLSLGAYRGTLPATLADGTPHLLFFWATWCAPCKASLPELLAFEKDRHTPVVAITDEPSEQLDTFFKHFRDPFPATVGVDEERRAFLAYGVSGTPTFVLVDGEGRVQAVTDGYRPDHGLGIEGWSWTKPAEAGRLTGPGSP